MSEYPYIIHLLNQIFDNVDLLAVPDTDVTLVEIKKKLANQVKADGDNDCESGVRNSITRQEASFALLLENDGWQLIGKNEKAPNKRSYRFQVNGNRNTPDFQLVSKHYWISPLNIELKSTLGNTIVLNDGVFHDNFIYILSYRIKKERKVFIGLGQDVMQHDVDKSAMLEFKEILQIALKPIVKSIESKLLTLNVRAINSYKCKDFTTAYTHDKFLKVKIYLVNSWLTKRPRRQQPMLNNNVVQLPIELPNKLPIELPIELSHDSDTDDVIYIGYKRPNDNHIIFDKRIKIF